MRQQIRIRSLTLGSGSTFDGQGRVIVNPRASVAVTVPPGARMTADDLDAHLLPYAWVRSIRREV